jgi:hypothetical protein
MGVDDMKKSFSNSELVALSTLLRIAAANGCDNESWVVAEIDAETVVLSGDGEHRERNIHFEFKARSPAGEEPATKILFQGWINLREETIAGKKESWRFGHLLAELVSESGDKRTSLQWTKESGEKPLPVG